MEIEQQKSAWARWHRQFKGKLESASGLGSFLENTSEIRESLPNIFRKYNIKVFTDMPCGDWNWMRLVELYKVDYQGLDINADLIEENKKRYPAVDFMIHNALTEIPRKSDLILCRDFLFHLSFEMGIKVIENILKSGSTYLMVTTFPEQKDNQDLAMGPSVGWRSINIEAAPYDFLPPVEIIKENKSHACQGRILGMYDLREM